MVETKQSNHEEHIAEYELDDLNSSGVSDSPDGSNRAQRQNLNRNREIELEENDMDLPDDFEVEEHPTSSPLSQKPPKFFTRGVQLYILSMICGSIMKATSKLLVEQMDPYLLVFVRMSITSAIAVSYMWWRGVPHSFWGPPGVRVALFARGCLGFVNISMTYYGLQYLTLPDTAVLSYLNPLATCIAARVFLHEPYRYQQALASLVSLSGVIFIARPAWLFGSASAPVSDAESSPEKRALAVVAILITVFSAAAVMIILRYIGERAHALASVSNYSVLSTVGAAVYLAATAHSSPVALPKQLSTWGLMCVMGLFGFMLQFLTSKAIQLEQATVLSNLKYSQLLLAVLWEFLIWHDLPTIWSVAGMLLILSGLVFSARYRVKKQPASDK